VIRRPPIVVRTTQESDFAGIISLTREVYPSSPPWEPAQLSSHLRVFPEGQFVAVEPDSGLIVGAAASLIVRWDDYDLGTAWRDLTDHGFFTNHDPVTGRTLYGAEVMVRPHLQRRGIGGHLYKARKSLAERLGLKRIRAGARLRGYGKRARHMSAEEYVIRVIRGELRDPTLSFQLRHGFRVLAVVGEYLRNDPESLGYAAVIEWLNPALTGPGDLLAQNPRFART
jgi:GNAT superfamily N-acetyltransferase